MKFWVGIALVVGLNVPHIYTSAAEGNEGTGREALLAVRTANRNIDSLEKQLEALRLIYPVVRSKAFALEVSLLRSFFHLAHRSQRLDTENQEAKYWYAVALGEMAARRTGRDRAAFLEPYLEEAKSMSGSTSPSLRLRMKIHLAGMHARLFDNPQKAARDIHKILTMLPQDASEHAEAAYEVRAIKHALESDGLSWAEATMPTEKRLPVVLSAGKNP